MIKTNVMRIVESAKLEHRTYEYETPKGQAISGVEAAAKLGIDVEKVFKTLVTVGKSKEHYVFMIPVAEELDLKKAAAAVGEKSIEMLKSKDLLGLTGYVHGGCSPIGMKKQFVTTVHESAKEQETIVFSAGKIGFQVELAPADLEKVVPLKYADVIVS